MTGRTRLTLSSAVAVLLVSFCLVPLVTPAGWLFYSALLIAVIAGTGALGRRLPVPRVLVIVAQLVVLLYLLVLGFVQGSMLYGLLPGPLALSRLNDLLQSGFDDINNYGTPAPATAGLRLILIGSVALMAVAVDALAATYRRAALAGLPLLALYSVGSGLGSHGWGWLWFLLAAGGYLIVLFAEGQDRLSRWGRVFHGTGRYGGDGPTPLSRSGHRIGVVALAAALVVSAFLPQQGDGLVGGNLGHGSGKGGGTITAINPVVSLQADLNRPSNVEELSYTTDSPNAGDMYIRVGVSDDFDGVDWKPSQQKVEDVPSPLPDPAGLAEGVARTTVTTRIQVSKNLHQDWLPMPYPASQVDVSGNWRYEPNSMTLVGDNGQTASGLNYQVQSLALTPTAEQLRDAPQAPEDIRKHYLALPGNLPSLVRTTALQVTKNADTPYDKAVALQQYFADSGLFTYNTRVQAGTGINAITTFLRNKQGFCVHFSATMAAMARVLGIPSRVAIGFTSGTHESGNTWVVGSKDAHAWPELYFEGAGWLRFEPTPSRGTAPDYTRQATPTTPGAEPQTPAHQPLAQPSTGPSAAPDCAGKARELGACGTPDQAAPLTTHQQSSHSWWQLPGLGLWVIFAGLGALLLGLLLFPIFWRVRLRRNRLGPAAPNAAAAAAREPRAELTDTQVLAAWQELVDAAWDVGIPPDSAETPRRTVTRIAQAAHLEGESWDAAGRVALATERLLYARDAHATPELGRDVRTVSDSLWASANRWTKVRASVLPPSSMRLAWQLADRVANLRDAVRGTTAAAGHRVSRTARKLLRRRKDN